MHKDVSCNVKSCLPCQRVHTEPSHKLRHVLERSEPFELISLDHVGPREWFGQKVYYLQIVDHASRFTICIQVTDLTPETTLTVARDHWFVYFGAPMAVLTDRGTAFTGKAFRAFVTQQLCAFYVLSSPGYPKGNAICEAAHRAIEATIKARAQYDGDKPFKMALQDAVIACNATPHSSTLTSLWNYLFGMEPSLPGWKHLNKIPTEVVRRATAIDLRNNMLVAATLRADDGWRDAKIDISVGDIVVYLKTEYEKVVTAHELTKGLMKYALQWSLPCEVIELKDNAMMVKDLFKKSTMRQCNKSNVRKLVTSIPESLWQLNMKVIEREAPRVSKTEIMELFKTISMQDEDTSKVEASTKAETSSSRPRKRLRPQ